MLFGLYDKSPVCSLTALFVTRVLITLLLFLPLSHASPFFCVVEFWFRSIRNLVPDALYAKVNTNLISVSPVSRAEFIPGMFAYTAVRQITMDGDQIPGLLHVMEQRSAFGNKKPSTFPVQRQPHSCLPSEQTLLWRCFLLLGFFLA